MAKQKTKQRYWYYVLVFTNSGPKYVTEILPQKTARWDELGKPMEFSKELAEDLYTGLCLNFHTAIMVKSRFEIESQPYNYKHYSVKFEEKEENNNADS